MFNLSEVRLVKFLLYISRASQVTRYWPSSVMCVSAICSFKFRVLPPGREKGMRFNLEDDGGDISTPGDKRSGVTS